MKKWWDETRTNEDVRQPTLREEIKALRDGMFLCLGVQWLLILVLGVLLAWK